MDTPWTHGFIGSHRGVGTPERARTYILPPGVSIATHLVPSAFPAGENKVTGGAVEPPTTSGDDMVVLEGGMETERIGHAVIGDAGRDALRSGDG